MMQSAAVVAGATLGSRITGLVRDIATAYIFGAGPIADAFYVAYLIMNQVRRMVGEGSLVVAFVPVFTKLREERGEEEAQKLLASFWTLMIAALVVLAALGMLFSRSIVWLFTNPDFRAIPGQFDLAVKMNTQIFPYVVFIGLVAVSQGILNSYKYFFSSAVSQVLFNVAETTVIVTLAREFIYPGFPLVLGVLVGGALQLSIQLPYLWKIGMRFKPAFNFRHPAIKRIALLMVPSTLSVSIVAINTMVSSYFLTAFSGARAQYYYSNRLNEFPYGIFTMAIATVILPALSEQAAKRDFAGLGRTLTQGLKLVSFIIIPAAIALSCLAVPIIHVIFEHGAFGPADTAYTAKMLMMFNAGLWATAGLRLIMQAYYSVQDMKTPLWSASLAMAANLALCWYLAKVMGRIGVPLAVSLSPIITLVILWVRLPSRIGKFETAGLLRVIVFSLLASGPMAAALLFMNRLPLWSRPGGLVIKLGALSGEIIVGLLVYAGLAWLFRMEELNIFLDAFKRRVRRFSHDSNQNQKG